MERVGGVAAVCRRIGKRADDVQHLDDRAGPAVSDDDRQRVFVGRPDVDEVNIEAIDLGEKLRQRVEPRLESPEVIVVGPIPNKLLHRGQRHAL